LSHIATQGYGSYITITPAVTPVATSSITPPATPAISPVRTPAKTPRCLISFDNNCNFRGFSYYKLPRVFNII